tara:strand:+ start:406 stop:783 length:378 start_codon:yes stop_codon:yes gene_type:complete
VKCRARRNISNPEKYTMNNGRPATQGTCPKCGTKLFRLGGTPMFSNTNKPLYVFQYPQIDKLIETNIIEEKSIIQRIGRSTSRIKGLNLFSAKHKLVTYYRLNPKLKEKLDLEIKRRSLIRRFQR